MLTGPGDEILDLIEKGTADSVISKKYGVNTDQLRLFKSLHYGLSNQRMGYNEIRDYFPELNTYFQEPKKPSPAITKEQAKELYPQPAEDPWTIKGKQSIDVLNKALQENDDVVENTIKEHRYLTAKEQKLNEFAAGPRTDMPAAQALALQKQQYLEPEVKPQDIPVAKEEVEQRKAEIDSDENIKRDFLKKVALKKPEKAAEIYKSTYQLDASERAKGSEDKMKEVQTNLERLEKGELKYDPTTGQLIEPEGIFESLITGAFQRNEQLRKYERYSGNEKDLLEKLEYDRKYYNPDKPVPVPGGTAAEIGQMAGMEWAPLLKGAGVGAAATMAGNPEVAPFVNAMINAPEYYKRSYWSALEQTYNQLRNEGKEPEEALKAAQAQAEDEGKLGAIEGAVSSAIGSRIGLKSLPKLNISSGFKNAAAKTLSSTAKYAGEQTVDGVVDGLVAGYLQEQKNIAAGEKGIFRTEGNELIENVKGEVTFALAAGAMTKAGSALVDPKAYKKLLYHLARQPKETFDAKIGEMVEGGQMTPEDAKDVATKVEAQREVDKKIPEDIKDVSRQAMAEKIKERDELEKKLDEVDKALHPPLKEKIKKLEEEILEHSTHKKPEDQVEEPEGQEQQSEVVESIEQQIPGAENNMGLEGKPVPGISEQTTDVKDNPDAELKIETVEDFANELNKLLNKDQSLDKITTEATTPSNEVSVDEYHKKAKTVLDKLFPGIEVRAYDSAAEYEAQEGRPANSTGVFDPVNNRIAYNMEAIKSKGLGNTIIHEAVHPIVNEVIGKNEDALSDLFSQLEGIKNEPGMQAVWDHMNFYYSRGGKIQKAEAVTEFFTQVVDGSIDITNISENAINKIIDFVNKILKAIGVSWQISNVADLKNLSEAIKSAFNEQEFTGLASLIGKKNESLPIAEKLDALTGSDQENAIRYLIEKTPATVTDDQLRETIVKATGMGETDVQTLIDSVRKPPITPPAGPITSLSPDSKSLSLRKFNKLFEKAPIKKPNWFQRQWASLKNASAWMDNPYRFITKITEDINKEYGLNIKGQIPLGRMFEKSSAGRAALKIQAFVNEVINGRIGGRNLGRLKGEKYNDFQKYLAAKRIIDRIDTQERLREAGENSSRQTGNITRQDAHVQLEALENKYGDLDDFAQRAKAFHAHMDNMLQALVASGVLSQESYDNIKAENDFYAPFSIVQQKLLADQDSQPVGITGIVKRIKGINYKLPKTKEEAIDLINKFGEALRLNAITPEDYFNGSLHELNNAKEQGLITEDEYNKMIAGLENPGFALNDILDAAANMIYKSEGMALKNRMLQRLYSYKQYDAEGLYIQNVDGFESKTLPNGSTISVPKPLSSIKVEPGMAPIKLRVDGKDKFVAVNKQAAKKLTTMSNYEVATWMKAVDFLNRIFRAVVITLSPGFQVVNFAIDFVRSSMLSRYGPIAGKGMVQPLVNAILFAPQYVEALLHSALGNVGVKTDAYKQWMESDSFSKGMFDNLFDNEKRIREVSQPLAKRILNSFLKLKFIDTPGSILEQTHKLATFQRGLSVEGFKPEMFTAMLASMFNGNMRADMSQQEMQDAMDRLDYEVQNFAGSPNFPQTHKWMKVASIFLQFFSARVKGEMTDYRRVANLFTGKGEGVMLSRQDTAQIGLQFLSIAGTIAAYAIYNNLEDEDEEQFKKIPPYHRDNYLNIPSGVFDWTDDDGNPILLRDYIKVPLRGLTATMNVMANSFVKYYKRKNPKEFKKAAQAFLGNASPINLSGNNERELGESSVSNVTPMFKFFLEYSFNRDTHSHRDIIPDQHGARSMLQKYARGELKPYEVYTTKTPPWAIELSKYLYDELGIEINAVTLDHMENTMGNPTELYDKAIEKRLRRSKMKYPVYTPKIPED